MSGPGPFRSLPELYAAAHAQVCSGAHRCYYCGAPCGTEFPTSAPGNAGHVKDSFTGRDTVRCPGSPWVCAGCVLCLREDCTVTLPDGSTKDGQMARTYSWVITGNRAVAASKAHVEYLRRVCLSPPEPPFAISLSPDGQKHYLYRGVANRSREVFTVTFAGEPIVLYPLALLGILNYAGQLAACIGKPGLADPFAPSGVAAVFERYGNVAGEIAVKQWDYYRATGLGRLAQFLCPPKEQCQREYPGIDRGPAGGTAAPAEPDSGGVPPGTGGSVRPAPAPRHGRGRGGAGDRQPFLFDLGEPLR